MLFYNCYSCCINYACSLHRGPSGSMCIASCICGWKHSKTRFRKGVTIPNADLSPHSCAPYRGQDTPSAIIHLILQTKTIIRLFNLHFLVWTVQPERWRSTQRIVGYWWSIIGVRHCWNRWGIAETAESRRRCAPGWRIFIYNQSMYLL